MRVKYLLTSVLALCLMAFSAFGQSSLTGSVTDEDGNALVGAALLVKGTTVGAFTDAEGKYSLSVPPGSDQLLVSYVGYQTQTVTIGGRSLIDVALVAEDVRLDEMVVTALGISREEKSLGYAAQTVDAESVTKSKDVNFVSSLSGKVAGVNINNSGTMGGSANIVIRGYTSLTGNNQPLFVVDGIPISNRVTNDADQRTGRGGYDYGNAAMDINPEDIESVTVLKGAAATALYGSRAANGVIIVKTKDGNSKGKKGGIGVTLSTGMTMGSIHKSTMPTYQKQYGSGYGQYYGPDTINTKNGIAITNGYMEAYDFDGDGNDDVIVPMGEDASFGLKFDDLDEAITWESIYPELSTYEQLMPYEAGANDPTTFYESSMAWNTNVAINGGNENGAFRMSFTNYNLDGIVPGSSLERNNASFSGNFKMSEKLSVGVKGTYINTSAKGRYGTGYDARNPNQSFRQWYSVGTDLARQKEVYEATGKNISWNANGPGRANPTGPHYFDNPYYMINENYQTDGRDRIMGNFNTTYKFNDNFNVMGRVGVDTYDELQEERISVGSVDPAMYYRKNVSFSEINYDLIFTYNKNLSENLNFDANFGSNVRRTMFSDVAAETNGGLVVPGVYSLANTVSAIEAPEENEWTIGVNGYFGRASFGYDNMLYLDLAGRYDVSSTLPAENNAYFYPSASLSFVFSELMNSSAIEFGKLRLNYAEVGASAPALSVANTYFQNPGFGGVALASAPSTQNNASLLPENTRSLEAGVDMKFFENRLGLDLSVYRQNTRNQILPARVTSATGSIFQYVNAGEMQNQGIEVAAYITPIKSKDFSWDMLVNYSKNVNEVVELYGGAENLQLASVQGGITINATVGQSYGTIWGRDYVRDEASGEPLVYAHPFGGMRYCRTVGSDHVLGSIIPDFRAGINNAFKYKNVTASFLIDIQKGGNFFSLDSWYGYATGIYDWSAGTNDKGNDIRAAVEDGGGLPIGGVLAATDEDGNYVLDENGEFTSSGTENTEYGNVTNYANSWGYAVAPNALHVYDASFAKLRELNITYSFPTSMFENSAIGGVDLSLTGRNLWIIWKNAPYTDPEAGLSAGNIQGYQSGAYPAVRELGFNLKVRF
ncbi:MAG: SusC/RagA family TonB-linked outer membrane protein [Bacteroidia bacterium]